MSETSALATRLYGRRKGKKLSVHQQSLLDTLLPRLALDPAQPLGNVAALFPQAPADLWLEIGFGGGEHLAAEAEAHPDQGFIGCEFFENGVVKVLSLIAAKDLDNVRLYQGDAGAIIGALPAQSLAGAYLLYPDPWPKRRQRKRRFLSDEMLKQLARTLRPGAEIRFATDIDDNAGWTLARILRSPDFEWRAQTAQDWRGAWSGWAATRYEAKALAAGRTPVYLTFVRK
ncbi:tRNA (guanosine(46)-N7)-methyltransferase TrmB [Methylovirgula ligni]|uniref:tRNA (guanine-N(7)-)-methyltransferase n=1 Tax=Methylovirgula ligni TaxID=569860 RepID=A0A3D9YPM4_9HYPH|nr:tRNA (guanine(46)-N(7))-methyltransferase TrmB [Methylovirgula ligni]QAY94994.1 tRNA (guanosine(46)-N7)-methyltransferase TrmB [Methylovirgula ligni]REF84550.1 tRNA (guanine-N7-)-methyltransferase [Methylovirgula ligni]